MNCQSYAPLTFVLLALGCQKGVEKPPTATTTDQPAPVTKVAPKEVGKETSPVAPPPAKKADAIRLDNPAGDNIRAAADRSFIYTVRGKVFDAATGQVKADHNHPKTAPRLLQFELLPDGRTLFGVLFDGPTVWVDFKTGKIEKEIAVHKRNPDALSISPDGRLGATGDKDGRSCIWNLNDRKLVYELPKRGAKAVLWTAFLDNANVLFANTGEVMLWNIDEKKAVHTWKLDFKSPPSLTADRKLAASVNFGDGNTIAVWNPWTGEIGTKIPAARSIGVAIDPDGKQLLIANVNMSLGLWTIDPPRELKTFAPNPTSQGSRRLTFLSNRHALVDALGGSGAVIQPLE